MDLTLTEAAHLLGKSERQIRYMLRNGALRGRKDGARWLVERDSLPLTEAQRAQLQQRVERAEAALQQAVAPAKKATGERRPFSVWDLDAFRIGTELLGILRQQQRSAAAELIATCLGEVGCGCHAFESRTKQRHFTPTSGVGSAAQRSRRCARRMRGWRRSSGRPCGIPIRGGSSGRWLPIAGFWTWVRRG